MRSKPPTPIGTPGNTRTAQTLGVESVQQRECYKHPRNAEFFDWWSQVNSGRCPYRHQFDIIDHPRWASHIFLVRVESMDPWVYRFRLIGEEVQHVLGRSDVGLTLPESNWDLEDDLATHAYDEMMIDRRPLRFHGSLSIYEKNYAEFESIDAPFLGENGAVHSVIGLICRL